MTATIFVDTPANHTAQVESWLLGRGRLPAVVPCQPEGRIRYLVADADDHTVLHLRELGCKVTRFRD